MKSLSKFSIYPPGKEHAHKIAALHAKLFDAPWEQEFIGRLLDQKTTVSYVASEPNKDGIAGFLFGTQAADEAEILTLGVDVQYQHQGIASELLSAFLHNLMVYRAKRVFLEVSIDNIAADRLYKKYGFEVIGSRKNYYQRSKGSLVDAAIMSLSLEKEK